MFIRSFLKLLAPALLVGLLAASVASAESVRIASSDARTSKFAPGAKPAASVKLRTCRSSAYYVGRTVKFRVRMQRFSDTNAPQRLEMRLDVLRRLNEQKKFKRLQAPGLGVWESSKDSATIYQRDLTVASVEPAAVYKLRVTMRWVNPNGNHVEFRRKLTSRPCVQKRTPAKLKIAAASAVPVVGSNSFDHTITVQNQRASEAVRVPVAVYVDKLEPIFTVVESIGPKQSVDVHLVAPACEQSAYAVIDPLRSLVRLPLATQRSFVLPRCGDRPATTD